MGLDVIIMIYHLLTNIFRRYGAKSDNTLVHNGPDKQIKSLLISLINRDLIVKNVLRIALILFLVKDSLAICISAIYIQIYEF